MRVIDVGKHHEVCVSLLVGHGFRPAFVVAYDFVDGFLAVQGVVVCAAEVMPVPFHLAVFFAAAGKVEAEPAFDFVRFADFLRTI
jgi:hypothetical protein